MAGSLQYDAYGREIKHDINGNPVYARSDGSYPGMNRLGQVDRTKYNLGYDTSMLPVLKSTPGELINKGYFTKEDVGAGYNLEAGNTLQNLLNKERDTATPEDKARVYAALQKYADIENKLSPNVFGNKGNLTPEEAKQLAHARKQREVASMYLYGPKEDKGLQSLAKFAAIASGMYGGVTALGGAVSGGEGLATIGGEGVAGDTLGVEGIATPASQEGFSLSNYLGLDGLADTQAGRAVSGVKDVFSSPYGKAAKGADTVRTAFGDLSKNEADALKVAGVGGLSLLSSSMGSGGQQGSDGFTGFESGDYQKTQIPSYRSIFDKFKQSPQTSSSDPYEKFFNTRKRNFADGGNVESSQQLRKAVGYKGEPDEQSWQSWVSDPKNVAAKQNFAQSIAAISPSESDPYANYGQGPEKLFFEGLDKPINSSGVVIGSPQEDTDLNQAAKKAAGYTGGFDDPNEFFQWSLSNPDQFVSYLSNIHSTNPDFTPGFVAGNALDWNPSVEGNQNFGPTLNAALGRLVGYTGPVGGGQLGSGLSNDYFVTNPDKVSTYEALRKIVDPTYSWSKKFAHGGKTQGDGEGESGAIRGAGNGKDDKIPAMLSDGEHVITAQEVSALGDGSNDAGQKRLYEMRKKIREHATMNKGGHSPKSKSLASYLRGI